MNPENQHNGNDGELARLHEQRKLEKQKFDERRELESDRKQAEDFFEGETKEILETNNDEIKQIEINLGPDESKEFLKEIGDAKEKFTEFLNEYNSNIKNLDNEEQSELIKLFFEKLFLFKEEKKPLFEKIDKLDGDKLTFLIEDTKYNKDKHEGFLNTFDALGTGFGNGILLGAQKYQHLFEKITDGNTVEAITKMVNNISNICEEMGIVNFLKLIAGSVWEDFKKIFDSDQPTYKIAQSIGKLVLDVIISLISGGAGIVGKLAKTLDKIIPDGMIKTGIKHTGTMVGEISGLKSQTLGLKKDELNIPNSPSPFLSTKSLKELGIKGEMSRLTNELMYYGGVTPYIVFNEGRKVLNNTKDLKNWITKTNKELAKNGYKIHSEQLMTAITPDGNTVIKMVKLEKKLSPTTNLGKEAIKYLNLIEKGIENINFDKLNKIAILTGNIGKYEARIAHYKENNKFEPNLIKELKGELGKKYKIKEKIYA